MKALKAFIKPFETPQRSVKIKINLVFSLRQGWRQEGLNESARVMISEGM